MRPMTRQDRIDPQIIKIQKCHTPGCRPNGIMVLFQVPGYTKHEFPVWVCSSGHCSDYDEIPNLRRPDQDPAEYIKANALELARALPFKRCHNHPYDEDWILEDSAWGQEGHLWRDGHEQVLTLCLPRA